MAIEAVTALVPARLCPFATTVQARIDAVAPAVELLRQAFVAESVGPGCTTVEAMVDMVAATIELVFAMFADAIETVIDAVAEIGGHGRTCT